MADHVDRRVEHHQRQADDQRDVRVEGRDVEGRALLPHAPGVAGEVKGPVQQPEADDQAEDLADDGKDRVLAFRFPARWPGYGCSPATH